MRTITHMRSLLFVLVLAAAGAVVTSPVRVEAQSETNLANGVVVLVNEHVITYRDVEEEITEPARQLIRQYRRQPEVLQQKIRQLRSEALEQLVDRRLILDEFKKSGGAVPDRVLDDELRKRIRERFGDQVGLTRELQAKGITKETYRQRIREEIILDFMRYKNVSNEKILISPRRIQSFYETNNAEFKLGDQVKLRMIVLNKVGDAADADKKKLLEEIAEKVKKGAAFAEMAGQYSEGSQRKEGGDWGWVEKSVLREDLAEAAFKLSGGQMSGIIDAQDAYYLMLVEERKSEGVRPLSEVRDDIEKTLVAQERNRLQKRWLTRLRKDAFVSYF